MISKSAKAIVISTSLGLCSTAHATLLNWSGTVLAGSEPIAHTYFGSASTVLTADFTFDVGAGTPGSASINSASGTLTWGSHSFNVTSASKDYQSPGGDYRIAFQGSGAPPVSLFGPSTFTLDVFRVNFQLGANPSTTTLELADLLHTTSVPPSPAGACFKHSNLTDCNVLGDITTSSTTVVSTSAPAPLPAPAPLALVALGLLGFANAGRYRKVAKSS